MTTMAKRKANAPAPPARARRKPKTVSRNSKQYVVDENGRRIAVVLPLRQYRKLVEAMEDLEDLRAAEEARAEGGEAIPWEQVKAELRAEGKLR